MLAYPPRSDVPTYPLINPPLTTGYVFIAYQIYIMVHDILVHYKMITDNVEFV